MFGISPILEDNKGIIFILDLVFCVAIVVLALAVITQIKIPKITTYQNDLTYFEAGSFLTNQEIVTTIDANKDYVCRNFSRVYFDNLNILITEDQNICTNVFGGYNE